MAKTVTLKDQDNNDLYPVTNIDLVNGTVGTSKLASGAVTSAKIANKAVTQEKINWNDFNTFSTRSDFTVSSTTMTDKLTLSGLPAGKYLILLNATWVNYNGGANGECNMQCYATWGSSTNTSPQVQGFLVSTNYASCATVQNLVWEFTSTATVKMQCSVNWPARGTYTVNQAALTAIRLPY